MCLVVEITYACGHWDTEVTPCEHRGDKTRCQIRKLWPRISTKYCRPGCPGVSVRSPAPKHGWKLATPTPLPISEYPYTAVKQRRRALRARPSGSPITNASDPAPGIEPDVPSQGQTDQCLLTRWQPFLPTFCRGTPSKVALGNKEADPPTYQHGLMAPEAQMYEEGQQPLSNLVNQQSQCHVGAVDGAKDSGNQAASVPYNLHMMDGCSSDTSETMANDSNLEDNDGGVEHDINSEASIRSEWDIIAPPPTPELNTIVPDQVMADRPRTVDLANLCRPHGRITGSSDDLMGRGSSGHESRTQHRLTAAPLTAALNCHSYSTSDSENSDDDFVVIPDPRGGPNGKGTQKHHEQRQAASATPAAAKRYYADFEIDDDGCLVLKECLDHDGL
ncbi:hypothetical protein F4860DRAFT_510983 [Xylaria cubensis]|nr:hypothetical protein F4860DRAFT_510983 [Xylaria cubensis]